MNYRVGLTGGIGSGKSTVASLFADLGVPVIDTDLISHQLAQTDGAAIPALREAFGEDSLTATGALDRAKMRNLVFSDTTAKRKLENILHPLILDQLHRVASDIKAPYILVVIPLLFEASGYRDTLQRTLTVDCSSVTQIARAAQRAGMDETIVRAIIARQLNAAQRLKLADDVIQNDGTLDDLSRQIPPLHRQYLALSARSN
jgi:dephospho-CoA kinase